MQDTAGEVRINRQWTFFNEPVHMDVPELTDQQELIYISSERTLDVVWKKKNCRERWIIGTDGEKESQERECALGVIVNVMDRGIVVSEFELQLHYYVYFRTNTLGKGMNPLTLSAMD